MVFFFYILMYCNPSESEPSRKQKSNRISDWTTILRFHLPNIFLKQRVSKSPFNLSR